jgi:extracellular factor (EF) 3-hydroxypalmitic acid methyl ester biosynthesis protein
MPNGRQPITPTSSLDYKRVVDQRCNEAKRILVAHADACLAKRAGLKEHRAFTKAMNDMFLTGSDELEALFPANNEAMKRRYQKRMTRFLQASVFWRRVFEKPLGYAGDYLMMEMAYRCEPLPTPGPHHFSQLLDGWFLDVPSARAVRNRHDYLVRALRQAVRSGAQRIASLASGPCREVKTYLGAATRRSRPLEFIFVDFEDEALEYARTSLTKRPHKNVTCQFVNQNILNIIVGRRVPGLSNCDLVYTTGFTDYLPDDLLLRLLHAAHDALAPGGSLLIGQFMDLEDHPDRCGLQWVTDWNLIYRTPASVRELFMRTPFKDRVRIETEPEGLIMLAEATKAESTGRGRAKRKPAAAKGRTGAKRKPSTKRRK